MSQIIDATTNYRTVSNDLMATTTVGRAKLDLAADGGT